jgi:hypothetical protein
MGANAGVKRRWVALALVAAAGAGLWLWWQSLVRIDPVPALAAGPRVPEGTGALHPDFRGDWRVDLEASESIAPIARAKGRSALEALVLSKVPVTHVIRGDDLRMRVVVQTPLFDRTEEVLTDGTPTHVVDAEGNEGEAVTRWGEDGQMLVTRTAESLAGQPVPVTIVRSLDPDHRTMYIDRPSARFS